VTIILVIVIEMVIVKVLVIVMVISNCDDHGARICVHALTHAAMREPEEAPAMIRGSTSCFHKALSTPKWKYPLAPPPLRQRDVEPSAFRALL
jgi:hypothetical protein